MPVSDPWGKGWVAGRIFRLNQAKPIKTALDYGAGTGTYAYILRPVIPDAAFHAVEVWEPYVEEYGLNSIYDSVHVGDIRGIAPWMYPVSELAIFGDVLEHIDKGEAKDIIRARLTPGVSGATVICIPLKWIEQGAVHGNPYEVHAPENHWTHEEMMGLLSEISYVHFPAGFAVDTHIGDVVGYYLVRTGKYAEKEYDVTEAEDGAIQRS